jgi:hypothetical protein
LRSVTRKLSLCRVFGAAPVIKGFRRWNKDHYTDPDFDCEREPWLRDVLANSTHAVLVSQLVHTNLPTFKVVCILLLLLQFYTTNRNDLT